MSRPAGLRVVKSHAYGNDFLLVPRADVSTLNLPALARRMCHRNQGVGADGLILYEVLEDRLRMRLYNADGSASEISGNGVRCLAAYALDQRLIESPAPDGREVTIETTAGIKTLVDRELAGPLDVPRKHGHAKRNQTGRPGCGWRAGPGGRSFGRQPSVHPARTARPHASRHSGPRA